MKKGFFSVVFASAILGATSYAFAGAYGEAEQAEEIPAPVPAAVPAEEPPPVRTIRKFDGFLQDAETTRGLWAEIGSVYGTRYYDKAGDVEVVNTYAHISYGQEMFEAGLLMPYIYVHQKSLPSNDSADDFGDLRLYGKVIPLRTDNFNLGLGLIVSFPTAGDNLGTEAYGFNPFLTLGGVAGPVHIRYHAAYNVTTKPDTHRRVSDDAFDYFDHNLGVLYPINDMIVVRGEFVHAHLTDSHADPVSILPGVDISLAIGDNELVFRPTVGVGLNSPAPNWQAGLGIAFVTSGI